MPVYEVRYRAINEPPVPGFLRILAIARFTLMAVFSKWIGAVLFGVGLLQLYAYTGYLLLITNPLVREAFNIGFLPEIASESILRRFYVVQFLICVLLLLMAAPRMISPEIAHKALTIVYSRPVTRGGYILGKFLAMFVLLSLLTWVQTMVLFIMMLSFYQEGHAFWQDFWTTSLPAGLLAILLGVLMSVCLSMVGLACSSLTKSARYATVTILVVLFGSSIITTFVQDAFFPRFPDLGPRDIFYSMGIVWFDQAPPEHLSTWYLLFAVLAWCAVSYLLMRWRLRPMEIYAE